MTGTGVEAEAEEGTKTLMLVFSPPREVEGNVYFVSVPVETRFAETFSRAGMVLRYFEFEYCTGLWIDQM